MSCLSVLLRSGRASPTLDVKRRYGASQSSETLIASQNVSEGFEKAQGGPTATQDGKVDTSVRLRALRQLMEEEGVDAYIVPSEDAHGSEYASPSEQRRTFISG